MPTISLKKDLLLKALSSEYTDENFAYLCFEYGLELDDITSEKKMLLKEQGENAAKEASDDVIYRIDIPANRYDLLCLEGLSIALLVFQNRMDYPHYKSILPSDPKKVQRLHVKPETKQIRPFVVAAVLRDITFTPESYASFIDLQDKLHQNVGRKRTLVSIGTHDLDTVTGPFTYEALPPEEIKFVPLNQKREYTAKELMEFYSTHQQLKQYVGIIKHSPVYPVIKDKNGVILSLPPIINSEHSKITLNTKNVFIEITATDLNKAHVALDTLVTSFSYYCKNTFTSETCEVVWADGSKHRTPELAYRKEVVNSKKLNKYIGTKIEAGELASLLTRMCLQAKTTGGSDIIVKIPPTRHDILHVVDIYEDAAIAFGYNNILKTFPNTNSVAQQQPLNKLTDHLRQQIAQVGFSEILSFTLCSRDDISTKLRKVFDKDSVVQISNPKTLEFQVVRTTLIPGLLKSIASNKNAPVPLKIFEISDVVVFHKDAEQCSKNTRHLCAVYYDKKAGFEILHGLLDRIMQLLEIPWSKEGGYYLNGIDDETFFPKRCAQVLLNGKPIGILGVLHPEVIKGFELKFPCSALELNVELFV
ncbi:phenylalanine--tRNA ligase beta subunit [Cimex lectularius]|uniref:Phenylalanine--tRNA ligase beta subunit n=1 Tax=Cimex lectularius TaxID=79782 RepID=A0A8I6S5H2_CIMLE|nr:phenylalanine--tRNA ligase beta subunit [Cimex lectularius]